MKFEKDMISRYPLVLLVPLAIWLVCWQAFGFVPAEMRRDIDVSTLPMIERALFGSSLLGHAMPMYPALLAVSALPYLMHFALPFVFGAYLYLISGRMMCFFVCFGLLNFAAILTQYSFPTAPPWYYSKYGEEPASYDMPGDPGRFAVLDESFETTFFENLYKSNPMVFGAFPSLHAAWPFLIAAYYRVFTPAQIPATTAILLQIFHNLLSRVRWIYVAWIWFAAIYSTHHYCVDILGGVMYTIIAVFIARFVFDTHIGQECDEYALGLITAILLRLHAGVSYIHVQIILPTYGSIRASLGGDRRNPVKSPAIMV